MKTISLAAILSSSNPMMSFPKKDFCDRNLKTSLKNLGSQIDKFFQLLIELDAGSLIPRMEKLVNFCGNLISRIAKFFDFFGILFVEWWYLYLMILIKDTSKATKKKKQTNFNKITLRYLYIYINNF